MQVAIFGSSGFIGQHLVKHLLDQGHQVTKYKRRTSVENAGQGNWRSYDPGRDLPRGTLSGFDAVINLCGANLSSHRWSGSRKEMLRSSRIDVTRRICEAAAGESPRPTVIANASGVGFYGDVHGQIALDESGAMGTGFLAELCQDWEQATAAASQAGIRVVNMRIGLVLGSGGGALGKMLLPFKLGLGPIMGSGRQIVSWIALDDLSSAVGYILREESIAGPVNMVAPEPVTNREFTVALNAALGKPTWARAPGWFLQMLFGQMASETVLASQHAIPRKLVESGYKFQFRDIKSALAEALK